jgi:prophage maintenance system killer protein
MRFLNGLEFHASVAEGEEIILSVASGGASRERLLAWVEAHAGLKQ